LANFTINRAPQTIGFNPTVTTYTYSPSGTFVVSATASSSLAVSFASTTGGICSMSGSTVTILAAGTCTIQAAQAGNTDYSAASPVLANFTINRAPQTIGFTPASPVTYGVSPITLTATGGASGNAVTFSVLSGPGSISGSTLTVTGTGAIAVAANQAGNTNYAAATQMTANIVVNQATLTITANNATKIYGTANPTFSGTVTGQQNGDTFTESFSTSATVLSPVGSYAIVPSIAGTNPGDYSEAVSDGSLVITQAGSITNLTASSSSITPGQSLTLSATVAPATTGTPTGTVSFYDGATLLSTVALASGAASYTTSSLAPGTTHSFTAAYSGDTNFTASGSTSSASASVAPLDFTMTLSGPSSQTMVPGSTITYQVQVTPDYGLYAGTVNFAVSGLPPGATATFSPASILANGGPQTVTVTIQTATATAKRDASQQPPGRKLEPFALALLLLFGAGSLRRRGRALRNLLSLVLLLLGGAAATLTTSGCGAANGFFNQTPQSYSVTITATSGNLQHATTVTLNVQ
jgi:hypothetical protein